MVNVTILQNEHIKELVVQGHCQSAPYGKDLVCAGLSAIVTGLANAVDKLAKNDIKFKLEEGNSRFIVNNNSKETDLIMMVAIMQLQCIAENYPQFVQIKWRNNND